MIIKTPTMQELLEAGSHFGHKVSRGNPRMKKYIFGARDGVHIIDLAKTEQALKEATEAAYELGKSGQVMLIVGTKKQAQEMVEELAKAAGAPYMNKTWVPGFFTNFEELRKNIKKLNELKVAQEKKELSHYTKREQLLISRKLQKFADELGGIADLEKIPLAIFVVDAVSDNTAVKESQKLGLKIFGICDTNADPNWFDFPVPANDDGIKSIKLICETVLGAYAKGRKDAGETVGEVKKESKESDEPKAVEEKLDGAVAEETAIIEEEVEKKVVEDFERKVE